MTTPDIRRQYKDLVAAIVKTVPRVYGGLEHREECEWCKVGRRHEVCPDGTVRQKWYHDITLEDVLQAFWGTGLSLFHDYPKNDGRNVAECLLTLWNPGKSLAWHWENKPETITFLYSLLCKP